MSTCFLLLALAATPALALPSPHVPRTSEGDGFAKAFLIAGVLLLGPIALALLIRAILYKWPANAIPSRERISNWLYWRGVAVRRFLRGETAPPEELPPYSPTADPPPYSVEVERYHMVLLEVRWSVDSERGGLPV
jgi:hypothetical protein